MKLGVGKANHPGLDQNGFTGWIIINHSSVSEIIKDLAIY